MSETVAGALNRLAEEHARYKRALERIAREDGRAGQIAQKALHPRSKP